MLEGHPCRGEGVVPDAPRGRAGFCGHSDSSSPGTGRLARNVDTDAGVASSSVSFCVHRERGGKGGGREGLRFEDGEEGRK